MSLVITIPSVSWAGKGFPAVQPFAALADLVYGFDFRNRSSMLTDIKGNYVITPKRMDPVAGINNVTDSTIIVPVDSDQGIRVELGYLQSSEAQVAFSAGGATQFTIMVVGGYSNVAFPAGKVYAGGTPGASILFDDGSAVSGAGFTIEYNATAGVGKISSRIEATNPNLVPESVTHAPAPMVMFLTYDGTNWTLTNKTLGLSATGTNASLSVANPITMNTAWAQGKVNLGGNPRSDSTIHAMYPVLYQSAKWGKVLSAGEIADQYARCQASRPALGL